MKYYAASEKPNDGKKYRKSIVDSPYPGDLYYIVKPCSRLIDAWQFLKGWCLRY